MKLNTNTTLTRLAACAEAVDWAGDKNGYQLWRSCERGDWLLWIATMFEVDRHLIVQAACDCAEAALVHVPDGEDRPRIAVETARAWCHGDAAISEVREVRNAAADAAADNAATATYATDAATNAADAADAAAYATYANAAHAAHAANAAADADADAAAHAAATNAADAADAAAHAAATNAADAAYAAANAARKESLKRSAALVRKAIPWRAVKEAWVESEKERIQR